MSIDRPVGLVSSSVYFVVSLARRFRFSVVPLIALLVLAYPPAVARADIVGFNNLHPSIWTYKQSDSGSQADLPNQDTIHITNLGSSEARSIFYNTPQSIGQFEAKFTYQALNAINNDGSRGITFTVHNDPRGADALGGSASSLGYGSNGRIVNSSAVTLRLDNTSGLFFDGVIGGGSASVSPVNLLSGHLIDVTLVYDGFLLSQTLVDRVTSTTYAPPPFIVGDLSSRLGGPTAYVGFTASTNFGVDQYISDFSYTVPEPATLSLLVLGGAALLRRKRRAA